MKNIFISIFILLGFGNVYAQNHHGTIKLDNTAIEFYKWDIKNLRQGALMFLDVPYSYKKDDKDVTEYLTLTVAKYYSKKTPKFIDVMIPDNVSQNNGIFMKFAKTVKDDKSTAGWKFVLDKDITRFEFKECSNNKSDSKYGFCRARIMDGSQLKTNQDNFFRKFLNFNHVIFLFVYPNGSHKSVMVPLDSFKQQYKNIHSPVNIDDNS